MSTREMQLISRIVRSGDLGNVIEWGITADDFLTPEGLAMWNHIVGVHSMPETAGSVIGVNVVQQTYPTFILCDDMSMTTEALCAEVRRSRIYRDINMQTQKALELAQSDPLKAASYCQSAMTQIINLGMSNDTDVYFSAAMDSIWRKYNLKKQGVDFSICPWPWQPLNDETGGVQPDEYCIFFGRPKSMKSWTLAACIAFFYLMDRKVLIYTKEMTAENIFMRVAAILACIDYHGLRMGSMSPQEERSFYEVKQMARAMRNDNNMICLSGQDAPEGGDTIPWLGAKIERHEPDIVAIDGLYMMSDVKRARKREERLTNISRDLRQLILTNAQLAEKSPSRKPSPVLATLQANRNAAAHGRGELDEIMYSDAFGQDVTMAMRVINDKNAPTISLVTAGVREFDLPGFRIYGIPATNFSFHSNLTLKEIEKAKEKDDDGESGTTTKRKSKTPKSSTNGMDDPDAVKRATVNFAKLNQQ